MLQLMHIQAAYATFAARNRGIEQAALASGQRLCALPQLSHTITYIVDRCC